MSTVEAYLDTLERVADEAGALILEGYRADPTIRKKGRTDLVTEYDLKAEQHVLDGLTRAHPELCVIGEETHGKGAKGPDDALVVYVDPIDGTTNFAHGHPFFCVSLGICRGAQALAGVIVAPALQTKWVGLVGRGATRDGAPCRVSQQQSIAEAFCATGFSYNLMTSHGDNNVTEFAHVQRHTRAVRRCGSAALDLAFVADGTYDAYWERDLEAWDMAAGMAIVLAAGGRVTDYEGASADVRIGTAVATNGHLTAPMVELIRDARKALG